MALSLCRDGRESSLGRRRIRCGRGLGDSIYLHCVSRILALRGESLEVCTNYPGLFKTLPVSTAPFSRESIDIHAVYTARKKELTSQFQDCCISAGITGPYDMKMEWKAKELIHLEPPVVLVALPRAPMDRDDGFGNDLLPDCFRIQQIINNLDASFVLVGNGEPLYEFSGIDLDLSNNTSITELIDLASTCDGMIGYTSFFVPLAEALNKPGFFVFSSKGLRSKHEFIRQLTPKKLYHKKNLFVMDDCYTIEIEGKASEFYKQIKD